jgi:hypothetical protein
MKGRSRLAPLAESDHLSDARAQLVINHQVLTIAYGFPLGDRSLQSGKAHGLDDDPTNSRE